MPVTTPGPTQDQERVASWFTVALDNHKATFFSEVSGLTMEVEVVENTQSSEKGDTFTRRRPAVAKYSEITLKRTLTKDRTFYDWADTIRKGQLEFRANGAIVVHDMDGTPLDQWTFENAWPSKWSVSDLDVGSNDLMIETVVLQIELLKREVKG
jgi:phage tail-like protein